MNEMKLRMNKQGKPAKKAHEIKICLKTVSEHSVLIVI